MLMYPGFLRISFYVSIRQNFLLKCYQYKFIITLLATLRINDKKTLYTPIETPYQPTTQNLNTSFPHSRRFQHHTHVAQRQQQQNHISDCVSVIQDEREAAHHVHSSSSSTSSAAGGTPRSVSPSTRKEYQERT